MSNLSSYTKFVASAIVTFNFQMAQSRYEKAIQLQTTWKLGWPTMNDQLAKAEPYSIALAKTEQAINSQGMHCAESYTTLLLPTNAVSFTFKIEDFPFEAEMDGYSSIESCCKGALYVQLHKVAITIPFKDLYCQSEDIFIDKRVVAVTRIRQVED